MVYRELLEYMKKSPGSLQTKQQKKADSYIKYREWLGRQNKMNKEIK